ncbi:MAG: hypothetical protein IPH88_16670 [Bacteroidales bacterium]|nr:hypothetical protein [Bacteroidales bacterium]
MNNIGIALLVKTDGSLKPMMECNWQPQQIAFGQPLWHDFAWANQNDVFAVGTPEFIYVNYASSYSWSASPSTAGTFSGNGLTTTLNSSNTWQGNFTHSSFKSKWLWIRSTAHHRWQLLLTSNQTYFLFSLGRLSRWRSGYGSQA